MSLLPRNIYIAYNEYKKELVETLTSSGWSIKDPNLIFFLAIKTHPIMTYNQKGVLNCEENA